MAYKTQDPTGMAQAQSRKIYALPTLTALALLPVLTVLVLLAILVAGHR